MKTLDRLILLLAGAELLAACVQAQSAGAPLVASVKREGEGCRVTVSGQRVTSEQLSDLGRADPKRRAIVLYDREAPYKCVGAAIVTLQQAGLVFVDAAMWDDS